MTNRQQIPNLVFRKNYYRYFLFTEFDVIFNNSFYNRIISLIKTIETSEITIFSEENTNKDRSFQINIIKPNEDDLIKFYDTFFEDGTPMYCVNHFIKDKNSKWEIFVSIENELSIFACQKEIINEYNLIFEPYKNESLIIKYKIITDMFSDVLHRENFIELLEKNYSFSNY